MLETRPEEDAAHPTTAGVGGMVGGSLGARRGGLASPALSTALVGIPPLLGGTTPFCSSTRMRARSLAWRRPSALQGSAMEAAVNLDLTTWSLPKNCCCLASSERGFGTSCPVTAESGLGSILSRLSFAEVRGTLVRALAIRETTYVHKCYVGTKIRKYAAASRNGNNNKLDMKANTNTWVMDERAALELQSFMDWIERHHQNLEGERSKLASSRETSTKAQSWKQVKPFSSDVAGSGEQQSQGREGREGSKE